MRTVQRLRGFETIKVLADARRMEIMRLLMASTWTLTQLAGRLGHSAAWVRHHVKVLEEAGLVEIAEIRTTGKITEKYYRARADALILQEAILPNAPGRALLFSGSHDLGLEFVAGHITRHFKLLMMPVGSLDGLLNLRQGLCQLAGTHLLDESGEYNAPHIRHLFPERQVELITLAHRTQGLIVREANPKGIRGLPDLARQDVRFVNRNLGSGTRVWLDTQLQKARIAPETIRGYHHAVMTHTEAAACVERRQADAAIGLQAAAAQHGLGFVPLFDERYDLAVPKTQEKALFPLLDYIQSADFRHAVEFLAGYGTAHSGESIAI